MSQCVSTTPLRATCGSSLRGKHSQQRPRLARAIVRKTLSSDVVSVRLKVPSARRATAKMCVAAAAGDGGGGDKAEEERTILPLGSGRRGVGMGLGLLMAGSVAGGGGGGGGDAAWAGVEGLPEITDTVYIDVGLCDGIVRADRALGSKGGLCAEPEYLGRITIGLYGGVVPRTVENFVKLVSAPAGEGSYVGTVFHRVNPGRFVLAGQSGSYRLGQVQAPGLPSNPELLSGKAFQLQHLRPGTVSLAVAAATGEVDGGGGPGSGASMSGSPNTEFLITTGPAPVPSLDGNNIVFGRVLEGMNVVAAVAAVPTFKPSSNSRAWNQVAEWLKDERAEKARAVWSKPTKAIVITGGGVL